MEVTYKEYDHWDKETIETRSIETYLYENILTYRDDPIRLEKQATVVMKAMGRLISILLDKEVLNLDDLKCIAENYDETLSLKNNEF